jgi:hypothetical protein
MPEAQKFSFVESRDRYGVTDYVPYLPLLLISGEQVLETSGLLDTGSSVNVLPYHIGVQLGAVWEHQTTELILGGNLASMQARGLVVSAKIGDFSSIRLAFAWTQSNQVPLILGRSNFFLEFNVCFYTAQKIFEVRQR